MCNRWSVRFQWWGYAYRLISVGRDFWFPIDQLTYLVAEKAKSYL
jgi:hypothetical protein